MLNLFLFLSLMFLFTFLLGRIIEKIRVPWIFSALLLGSILAVWNPFESVTSSEVFTFLAQLGMYFLLFIIGFEIDLRKLKRKSRFILKATFFIILLEAFFGSILVHYVFSVPWLTSILVALSFATVGEAILVPILDEFRIVNSRLGQTIIGIGTFDDIIEVFALIFAVVLISSQFSASFLWIVLASLFLLFFLAFGLTKLKEGGQTFSFLSIETLFLFAIFLIFLFLGVGELADAAPLGALLAGIALKNFLPKNRLKLIKSEIRTLCYGFFAPIFFLWVGISMDMGYLASFPLLILLVVAVSKGAKILGSFLIGRKELGLKQSVLLGIGLSVRFSTSIIIIKLLLENALIGPELYSVIVASSIVFKFVIPVLFSNLLVKWGFAKATS